MKDSLIRIVPRRQQSLPPPRVLEYRCEMKDQEVVVWEVEVACCAGGRRFPEAAAHVVWAFCCGVCEIHYAVRLGRGAGPIIVPEPFQSSESPLELLKEVLEHDFRDGLDAKLRARIEKRLRQGGT